MSEELTPTSAAEWRKPREEGYLVTLPSGNVARLRPVALDMLVVAGQIPDILTPMAARALWGVEEEDGKEGDKTLEDAVEYIEFVNLIAKAAMLEPRICDGEKASEGCITLEDLEFDDRVAIQRVALLPASQMRRFRDRQAANVEAIPDGESDQPATE